ncbi:MAG: DMT family transporter [Pirellulales bacterium]|nr:DMT family transporter [Pirellulales bacterium]
MDLLHTGELAALATAVLWTFSTVIWTSAGKRGGVWAIAFLRLLPTLPLFILYGGLVQGKWLPPDADGRTWTIFLVSGLFGFFCCDLCLFRSFLLMGPRLSLLVFSLSPPASAILAWWFLGDHLNWRQWLGMAVTLAGIAWVVLEEPEAPEERTDRSHLWRGVGLALIAVAASAIGNVTGKQGMDWYHDPFAATFIRILGALPGYLVFILILGRWPNVVKAVRNLPLMGLLVVGSILGPFLGVVLYMIALRDCPTGVAVTITSTMPVLILPFSIFLYHEKVSPRAVGGALLSVLGIAMLVWGT